MNAYWQAPIIVLSILTWLAAPPKSIGEAAAREAMRRQMTPKSRVVLTNLGQRPEIPLAARATTPPDEPPPANNPQVAGASAAGAAATTPPAAPKQDEAWWRSRMTVARDQVERDKVFADVLQTKINGLQRDTVNEDNPIRAGKLREELQKSLDQLAKTNKSIADGQKAVAAIQEEARRADVPPGWVR